MAHNRPQRICEHGGNLAAHNRQRDRRIGSVEHFFHIHHLLVRGEVLTVAKVGDELVDLAVEHRLAHHIDSGEEAGNHHHDGEDNDDPFDDFLAAGIHEFMLGKMEVAHHDEGGEGDEEGVDKEEVGGPEGVRKLPCGDAIAGGAERRHQGGGDGHTRHHRKRQILAGSGHDAGQSAEGGDEHIVDGGTRTGQKFRLGIAQRRQQEVEGGSQQADNHHHQQVANRLAQQFHVVDTHRKAHPVDRSHQGGNQHGADDDGGGVDIQSHRSDDDGEA